MDSINELTKLVLAFREARDWAQFHKPKDLALSLMLEAAELAEHFQWKNDDEIAAQITEHRDEIADELCDVLYCTLVMAHDFDIDLGRAFLRKLKKNEEKYPVEKARGRHAKYDKL